MKILMVCLGNICRSPLAEGIMREKLRKYEIDAEVDSAGTNSYHIGEAPDPRSQDTAQKHGLDISYQRARQFLQEDFNRFDLIFAMDGSNFSDMAVLAPKPDDLKKLHMILNIANPASNKPVPDPYYGGKDGFEKVYKMLDEACELVAKQIVAGEI